MQLDEDTTYFKQKYDLLDLTQKPTQGGLDSILLQSVIWVAKEENQPIVATLPSPTSRK